MKHTTGRGPKKKGREFENEIVASILETFPQLSPNDVLARSMGDPGQDVILSEAARKVLPLALELKRVNRVENLDMKKAFSQAKANCQAGQIPAVVHREDRHEAMIALYLGDLILTLASLEDLFVGASLPVVMKWSDLLDFLGGKK